MGRVWKSSWRRFIQSCIDGDWVVGEPRFEEGSRGIVGMSFSTMVVNLLL